MAHAGEDGQQDEAAMLEFVAGCCQHLLELMVLGVDLSLFGIRDVALIDFPKWIGSHATIPVPRMSHETGQECEIAPQLNSFARLEPLLDIAFDHRFIQGPQRKIAEGFEEIDQAAAVRPDRVLGKRPASLRLLEHPLGTFVKKDVALQQQFLVQALFERICLFLSSRCTVMSS
ncbi:hypothetical protein [Mesorhizobium sp. WSM2239]|uniref:Uncharacterized protein n=2 Tax=unclassified Mesorhizobium TaxID=325217 RepID=A0AAU8DG28_9HYPH